MQGECRPDLEIWGGGRGGFVPVTFAPEFGPEPEGRQESGAGADGGGNREPEDDGTDGSEVDLSMVD